jgi:hypothetical protein
MLEKLGTNLLKKLTGKISQEAAMASVPGAVLNAGFGLLMNGPKAAVGYGAGDFLLNYPVVALARKFAPGTTETIVRNGVKSTRYAPSKIEEGVNFAASLASAPLTDYVTRGALLPQQPVQQTVAQPPNQEAQIQQELIQRSLINRGGNVPVSPGTMSQLDAFHYPGLTLPPEVLEMLQQSQ